MMFHFHHFYLAVDLFLVLSGFIISFVYHSRLKTEADYATFLWRRIARLAPLHWATLLFFVMLGLLAAAGKVHANHQAIFDWNCLVPNALALHAFGVCNGLTFNYVSWSISAEMGMYAIAPVLLWLGRTSKWLPLFLCAATAVLLSAVSNSLAAPWYQWTWDLGVIRALPDFSLGVTLFYFRAEISRIPAARLLLLASVVGFIIGSFLEWPDTILLALVYLMAVAGVACDRQGGRRDRISALGVYGQLTYSMYMLHPLVIAVFMTVIGQQLLHLHGAAMNCWLVLVAALVAPVSYLSLELFEAPARRWLAGSWLRLTKIAE